MKVSNARKYICSVHGINAALLCSFLKTTILQGENVILPLMTPDPPGMIFSEKTVIRA
jgi:hypothetical protein